MVQKGVYKAMSANIKYLQAVESLQKEYLELGHQKFVERYRKYDAIIGSIESQEYIKQIFNQNNQSTCITSQK